MVKGVCLLIAHIDRLGRHGAGLVGVLNEVPAAVEYKIGPPAVQCESQAPPDLLEVDGLAHFLPYFFPEVSAGPGWGVISWPWHA